MPPLNRLCPQCGMTVQRLRNVAVFDKKNYCCADCAIDAWQEARSKGDAHAQAAEAARRFGSFPDAGPESPGDPK